MSIYPEAVWRPGDNAGYAEGRASMRTVVAHYTVGRDSRPIGERGYFNFLVARDGTVTQFAEADAVTWHAGNWNDRGPGIEIEYLDEPTIFTDAQREATARLVKWLNRQYGIPLDYYDGPRVETWHGFIAHGSLIQTGDPHTDYWPREDWDLMVGPRPAAHKENDMLLITVTEDKSHHLFNPNTGWAKPLSNETFNYMKGQGVLAHVEIPVGVLFDWADTAKAHHGILALHADIKSRFG